MNVEEWLKTLTLPCEVIPEDQGEPMPNARIEIGCGSDSPEVLVNVIGTGAFRVNFAPYVAAACRIVEQETGMAAMQFVYRQTSYKDEPVIVISVIPHPTEKAGARIIG